MHGKKSRDGYGRQRMLGCAALGWLLWVACGGPAFSTGRWGGHALVPSNHGRWPPAAAAAGARRQRARPGIRQRPRCRPATMRGPLAPAETRTGERGGVGGAGGRRAPMAAVTRRARQRPHPARADRRPSFFTLLVARDEGEVRRVVVSTLSRRKGQLGERGGSFFLAVCQTHRAGGRRCDSLLPRHTKCRGRGERRLDTLEENPFTVRPLSGPQKTAASTNWREVSPSARCQ